MKLHLKQTGASILFSITLCLAPVSGKAIEPPAGAPAGGPSPQTTVNMPSGCSVSTKNGCTCSASGGGMCKKKGGKAECMDENFFTECKDSGEDCECIVGPSVMTVIKVPTPPSRAPAPAVPTAKAQ